MEEAENTGELTPLEKIELVSQWFVTLHYYLISHKIYLNTEILFSLEESL